MSTDNENCMKKIEHPKTRTIKKTENQIDIYLPFGKRDKAWHYNIKKNGNEWIVIKHIKWWWPYEGGYYRKFIGPFNDKYVFSTLREAYKHVAKHMKGVRNSKTHKWTWCVFGKELDMEF